jgi:hypothetical protein
MFKQTFERRWDGRQRAGHENISISSSVGAVEGRPLLASVNFGSTEPATARRILNHSQCFWSTFTGFYTKSNNYCLCSRNYGYKAQKLIYITRYSSTMANHSRWNFVKCQSKAYIKYAQRCSLDDASSINNKNCPSTFQAHLLGSLWTVCTFVVWPQ